MGSGDSQGLLARGVDVILGAHPHVVQPAYRVTVQTESGSRDAYVVYSLGNFLQAASHRWPQDSGLVVYVHLEKLGDKTTVTGLSFLPVMRQTVRSPLTVRLLPVLPGLDPADRHRHRLRAPKPAWTRCGTITRACTTNLTRTSCRSTLSGWAVSRSRRVAAAS